MNAADQSRFEMLQGGGEATAEYLREFYGLDWPWTGELREDFDAWLKQSPRRTPWDEDRPSRYLIEGFLQTQRLESKKWAACRLGMDETSLSSVLDALPKLGLRPRRYEVYSRLISTSFGKDLDAHLPSMKFRTFGSHDSYCEFLHADLANRLGVTVQPLLCAIAGKLSDTSPGYPRSYARQFDCITLDPLSVRHQIVMDFGKPLYLPPDVCSKRLYVQHRAEMHQFHAGSTEPSDLSEYEVSPHA